MQNVPPHVVLVTLFPGVDALEATGPAEVFAMANVLLPDDRARYDVRFGGTRTGRIPTFSGVALHADTALADIKECPDTLLITGRMDITERGPRPYVDPDLVDWLRRKGKDARRIAAPCAGAHVAAAAGLLDGHKATTHWATAGLLAAENPSVEVEADPIFVRSGKIWTGAGITSSMDLALALVAEDHGDELTLKVAQHMVMYVQRPGGQSQFSVPLAYPTTVRRSLGDLRRWIADHLEDDLSVGVLAERMSVSPRHLSRIFRADLGTTPAEYVEALRVEQARRLLERTSLPPAAVASASGFGSIETLHRVFRERLGTTPGEYRQRFTLA